MTQLEKLLSELVRVEGIKTAVVVDRNGFVIDGVVSSGSMEAEDIGAVITTGIGSSEVMGRELEIGDMKQSMVEFKDGIVVASLIGDAAILAVVADLNVPLGNVRFQIRKRLEGISSALEG